MMPRILVLGVVVASVLAAAYSASSRGSTRLRAGLGEITGLQFSIAENEANMVHGSLHVLLSVPSSEPSGVVLWQGSNRSWPVDVVVSSGPLKSERMVLNGAHEPPMRHECAVPISISANGNASPLTCRVDHVNAGAWLFYSLLHPSVMSLGRTATARQVFVDVCGLRTSVREASGTLTLPEYESAYELAATYNGWRFAEVSKWETLMINGERPERCVAELLGN